MYLNSGGRKKVAKKALRPKGAAGRSVYRD